MGTRQRLFGIYGGSTGNYRVLDVKGLGFIQGQSGKEHGATMAMEP